MAARRAEGVGRALADAQRHLAAIYELRGDRERALAARRVAADSFATNGLPGEAAAERLVVAGYLQSAGKHGEAVALARAAGEEAQRAERIDLRARALGLRASRRPRAASSPPASRPSAPGSRWRWPTSSRPRPPSSTSASARRSRRRATTAARTRRSPPRSACAATGGADALEHVCLSCVAYVLRELGDWDASVELCHELQAGDVRPDDTLVADGALGAIHAFRGEPARARPLLLRSLDTAARLDVVSMQLDTAAALAYLEDQTGDRDAAAEHCRFVLERWERSEDVHYAVWGLRWAACFFAADGARAEARACADALARIAAHTGHPDARAALAHALAETALLDDDAGDRRRADRARAGAAGHARHPLRARADPAARRRRPRRRRRARARARAPRRAPTGSRAAWAPARWPCRPPRRPRASASRSSAGSGAARPPRTTARGPDAPRGRGHAPARRRAHQPRDRPRAVPQPAHGRRARAQHLLASSAAARASRRPRARGELGLLV